MRKEYVIFVIERIRPGLVNGLYSRSRDLSSVLVSPISSLISSQYKTCIPMILMYFSFHYYIMNVTGPWRILSCSLECDRSVAYSFVCSKPFYFHWFLSNADNATAPR